MAIDKILNALFEQGIRIERERALIFGTSGDDNIRSIEDHFTVRGLTGADRITVLADNQTVYGGGGDDVIEQGQGRWDGRLRAHGDSGNDVISAGAGEDVLSGGTGSDTIVGGPGGDAIVGGEGDDLLYPNRDRQGGSRADNAPDTIQYSPDTAHGNDTIVGLNVTEGDRLAIGREWRIDLVEDAKGYLVTLSGDEAVCTIRLEGMTGGISGSGWYVLI
ncbi:hypothetical protein [Azospirillum sp.]|uniref:calcium-binding protein n=1 Tax=Azospirillum sp. TaxID=34012 RepID=UPI002D26065D|nr:hypothetical protein [Azospirillum sp.]HYF90434.1 hypothetical protein [Azospirillum sp.]